MNRLALAFSMIALVAFAFVQPVSAALTSVVEDPVGDACCNSEAYRDIVKAEITKQGRTFFFSMEIAGPIPETPEFPAGSVDLLSWGWSLDTNSETFPAGYPFKDAPVASEYFVWFLWDGTRFTAELIDRTPLLTGGTAIITPLAFTIEGAVFKTSVNAEIMGDPSAFLWLARTGDWRKPLGTSNNAKTPDIAPDNVSSGHVWAPWPS